MNIRVDPERQVESVEVVPEVGITVGKHLVDFATSYPSERKRDAVFDRRMQESELIKETITGDIELSKVVVEKLTQKQRTEQARVDGMERVLQLALDRERSESLAFIDVAGNDPRSASKKVLEAVFNHPTLEIEPIDLSSAFDKTNPAKENNIDQLFPLMILNKSCSKEELPSEIRVMVPDKDRINSDGSFVDDVKFDLFRYVCLDALPKELRRVVMTYQPLCSDSSVDDYNRFIERVEELMDTVKSKEE